MTAALVALLFVVLPTKTPKERPAWKAQGDIVLSAELRETIGAIAAIYHAKTKRTLEITSGVRTPERQAAAMYGKLAAGSSLALYKRQALLGPIKKAYRDGRRAKLKKAAIVERMAEVIRGQVARGEFISRHLKGRAFDARSAGLSARQRAAFLAACREVGGLRVIVETRPPHFHVELVGPRAEAEAEAAPPEPPSEATPPPEAPPTNAEPHPDDEPDGDL